MGRRAPAPQRHRHHHRPVILFKELGGENKAASGESRRLLELSPPGSFVVPIIDCVSNRRHKLTAHCFILIFKYPNPRSPLRLPRYKDRKASAAGTCPTPKPPGNSSNRALPRHQQRPSSFSRADESRHALPNPSTTAVPSSSSCPGTRAAPD